MGQDIYMNKEETRNQQMVGKYNDYTYMHNIHYKTTRALSIYAM